jgi:hypothetical protein
MPLAAPVEARAEDGGMRLLGQANPVPARGRLLAPLASALPAHPITVDGRDAPVLPSLLLWP